MTDQSVLVVYKGIRVDGDGNIIFRTQAALLDGSWSGEFDVLVSGVAEGASEASILSKARVAVAVEVATKTGKSITSGTVLGVPGDHTGQAVLRASSRIGTEDVVTVGAAWTEVGHVFSNPDAWAGNRAKSFGRIGMQMLSDGTVYVRVREVLDDGTENILHTVPGHVELATTGGVYKHRTVYTDVLASSPVAGTDNLYILEAQLGTATVASIRYPGIAGLESR